MSEQTQAVSSPAIEVDRGPLVNWTPDERAEFRRTGEMPEPPKVEEPASSDAGKGQSSEAQAKPAGATETPKKPQEQNGHRKPGAEKRIAELTSETKRLKQELEALKTKPAAEPAKPQEQPKPQAQPQQVTRPKPTAEDKDKDGKAKYATYEDFVEDLADWKAEQRWAASQRDQAAQAQMRETQTKLAEAEARYPNFKEVVGPTVKTIVDDAQISPVIKQMLNDSEIFPDLVFALGSDQKELADFIKMAKQTPGKAIRYLALTESLIHEELESKAAKPKPAEQKTEPAKPQSNAPKPPSEVGGRAASPGDELDSAAQAGDFRAFKAASNRRALARLKG